MTIHELIQGSPEWLAFREEHFGASEAAAMMGLSKKTTRNELLHLKHTGNSKEFSAWVQENILDHGHAVEALARPLVEELIGEELYPATCSEGKLSASCDGLKMDETIAFEHKQWNAELARSVAAGVLPEEHIPQCQQILLVTKAEKLIFVVSDGTRASFVYMWVYPDGDYWVRLMAGWQQFEEDLAAYVPPEVVIAPVGRTPETLPALHIEVQGMVTASNLEAYRDHALAVFKGINRELSTDQDFANADKIVKWCGDVEERLAAAKQHALSQTESIDALFRAIDDISAEARATRLELDRLVKGRKEQVRTEIVTKAKQALASHVLAMNERLGADLMPTVGADFEGVIKGKRTVDTLQNAADTELARAKIDASSIADRIQKNLCAVPAEHAALFPDLRHIVTKACDDFAALVQNRVTEHQTREAAKIEAQREAIRQEEVAKLAQQTAQAAPAPAPIPALPVTHGDVVSLMPATVRQAMAPRAVSIAPTLKLGVISERLGFTVTADFLASLGFEAYIDRSAKLYRESDFPLICRALIEHIESVCELQAA